jgi:hypothetical protein
MVNILNSDLSPEQVRIYKKIFIRHLKEDCIYNVVKSNCFTKRNLTFYDHVTKSKGSNHLIGGLVDTIWGLINSMPQIEGFTANVKASLILMEIAMDEDFFDLCKTTGENDEVIKKLISQIVSNELSFLFDSITGVWEDNLVSIEDAKKINSILLSFDNGSHFTSRRKQLMYHIHGFKPITGNEQKH